MTPIEFGVSRSKVKVAVTFKFMGGYMFHKHFLFYFRIKGGAYQFQGVPADPFINDLSSSCKVKGSQCSCDLSDLFETCELDLGKRASCI